MSLDLSFLVGLIVFSSLILAGLLFIMVVIINIFNNHE